MNLTAQLLMGLQAIRFTVTQIGRWRLWVWALPLAAAEVAVIVAIWNAAHPWVSWLMAPILLAVGGADTLHYPRVFELLPAFYQRADLVIGALIGAVVIGGATPAFAARFHGQPVRPGEALARALSRAPQLILVQLPTNLLLFAVAEGLGRMLGARGGIAATAAPVLVTGLLLAVQAAFFYATPMVALEGDSAIAALRAVPGTWRRGFVPAFVAGLVTLVALTPLHLPGLDPGLLVREGRPELAGWLTLLQALAGLVNVFLLTGAATLLYLSTVREREGA